jgi:hypothetical protein
VPFVGRIEEGTGVVVGRDRVAGDRDKVGVEVVLLLVL